MWAVVAAVGMPSAWRNPTAAALVIAWLTAEIFYIVTGNSQPVGFYIYPDIFVIGVIFCKPDCRSLALDGGDWHQLKCLWLERSFSDRCVLLVFPLMWAAYVAPIHPFYQWQALWALCILQFLFASAEPLAAFHSRRNADAADSLPSVGELLVACRDRGYG